MATWTCCVNGSISVCRFVRWNRSEFKINFYIYVHEIKMKTGGNKNTAKNTRKASNGQNKLNFIIRQQDAKEV